MGGTTMHDWLNRLPASQGQRDQKNGGSDESAGVNSAESNEAAAPHEVMMVTYQRFWFDHDLRDGTYTPAELQQAKLLIKRGPVLHYRLSWPGGTPQPISGRELEQNGH